MQSGQQKNKKKEKKKSKINKNSEYLQKKKSAI
jgi:hypothetical protein